MKPGLIALGLFMLSFSPVYAQSSGNSSIDAQHEAVMTLLMTGNEAIAEGAAASDPQSACVAYKRAVASLSQATKQTKALTARLNPNDPAQTALLEHIQTMASDTQTALTTAQTGVKANCH